jgi:sulfate permease, SulP family
MLSPLGTIYAFFLPYFLRPIYIFRNYHLSNLQLDVVAGLTVAVILLPQAIAYALIAELPAQVGLYTAVVAAIIGALWGSSNHLHTGPTNAASLLVLSILLPLAAPGSPRFVAAAGLLAVMVGVFRLTMGLARLGMLVNFVSDSVIVGFTAGAGVLISFNQVRHLLRLDVPSTPSLMATVRNLVAHLLETHLPSLLLGLGVIGLIIVLRRFAPKLPGPLLGTVVAATVVAIWGLDQVGVKVIGQLPRSLPPLSRLPLFDVRLIGELSPGALAIAAIGLVEAMSIARSIAGQTGQRLDSNQEFIGQGLANIASGFFSGYPGSGSFTRSVVNYKAGGQTPLAGVLSGLFVLIAMIVFGPLAAYVPRPALAGVLIVTAHGMIDRQEMSRIWRGTRGDTLIMTVTLLATLLLPLQFAVLTGILMSFSRYLIKTGMPRVIPVLPDETFRHLDYQPEKSSCPQLGILTIWGDIYFGAAAQVEDEIQKHLYKHPDQRLLLLRMHSVNQCDISGVHMLESVRHICQTRGGDLFLTKVHAPVLDLMKSTGFYDEVGADHFLEEDSAIRHLFYKTLDPAVCIYECEVRVFQECQNLPKRACSDIIPLSSDVSAGAVTSITPEVLWQKLQPNVTGAAPLVIDVREPREFKRGHIPRAQLMPLPKLVAEASSLPEGRQIVFVCHTGRRSRRVAQMLQSQGRTGICTLQGGLLAWKASGLLEAVDN